ncbi:MAG: alpha/beta fold hydrolase [Ornithinimicrobium sp.]|uniref:alpha/beta fold hydrolase n=1 Tax=Ornithinimicrobium sp. TaxID=1977084 RepID=UPI003D9B78B2
MTHARTLQRVQTSRLDTAYREAGDPDAPTLVLVHGNVSSSVFFEDLMDRRSDTHHLLAPDFRGYGDSQRLPIDATRGLRDLSDDLAAFLEALGADAPVDLLGWSVGGGVLLQFALDHPQWVRRLVLEAPMSPYGFGGTTGEEGRPDTDDFAGSGGGTANPEFCAALADGDRGGDGATSPLATLRGFYVKPEFSLTEEAEQRYLDGMLATSVGDDVYPGDTTTSPHWPHVAPGQSGMNNAISPKYCDLSGFADLGDDAPPVLWVRGAEDQIVANTSVFDLAFLGSLGVVPGWPGAQECPPQPMIAQLRAVLAATGRQTEILYEDCGHSPHLEHPERFAEDVRAFLA